MMKRAVRLRKNSNSHRILEYLAAGSGIVIVSLLSPLGGTTMLRNLFRGYCRRRSFERRRFLNDLKHLQVRNLIDYQELEDGKIKMILTKAGKEKVLVYRLHTLHLQQPKRWDKKWRLVTFDIPHASKRAREAFRKKLHELRFYPLQKSVFITPYHCEDEIDFLASLFDVRKHICILNVSHFEGEEKLRHYFKV